jgi:alpha-D-xyloside xylohydrolase
MKQGNRFIYDMLNFELPAAIDDVLWIGEIATDLSEGNGTIIVKIPFQAQGKTEFTLNKKRSER